MLGQEEMGGYCPYCGEPITLLVDPSAGEQTYIEDCAVCCRPIQISISEGNDGALQISLRHEDEAD
ncbi:CPXCG motif-containing cysteine-rich protein [Microbulbifer litoralis]|uniref:CPXCG motif-containing cysteine-rich protein n=1 Tax=Microbulbifer litoralis TaxID=2933965 RepID=UPI00202836E4|nr:CPXCG motif-containing cysteine-rich protein [Microbulbifer sp. GX H0434]